MRIEILENPREQYFGDVVELLTKVDKQATGVHYDTSSADMSRALLFEGDSTVPDRTALRAFYEEFTDTSVVAVTDDAGVIGVTMVEKNHKYFQKVGQEYAPYLGVTFSAVSPNYQNNGVWKRLRRTVESDVVPRYDVDYLLTAAPVENTASRNANKSMGMERKGTVDVDGEDKTIFFVKRVE